MQHLCKFNYKASRNRALLEALSDCCVSVICTEKTKTPCGYSSQMKDIWDGQGPAEQWEEMNCSGAEPF